MFARRLGSVPAVSHPYASQESSKPGSVAVLKSIMKLAIRAERHDAIFKNNKLIYSAHCDLTVIATCKRCDHVLQALPRLEIHVSVIYSSDVLFCQSSPK